MKTIIIDDQVKSRRILKRMIHQYCQGITVDGEADNVDDAVACIKTVNPDIIFLDVELGHESGFDILGQVPDFNFQTIFVTAYDSFAIKAIKWKAQDYLLKPIDPEELIAAVNNAVRAINNNKHLPAPIDEHNMLNEHNIGLPTMEGLMFVPVKDMVRCEAKGPYTEISFTNRGKLTVCKSLQLYEQILSKFGFYRIHKSHLINLGYIKEYIKGRGGNVVMSDGATITVALRKKEDFLKHILH